MTKSATIQKIIKILNELSTDESQQVFDFTDNLLKQHEEQVLKKGIETLREQSRVFQFLNDDEDLYNEIGGK